MMIIMTSNLISFQVMASGSVLIDGKDIKTRDQLHNQLSKKLGFPGYYGRSLTSIYEVLSTDFRGDNIIKIKHVNLLKAKLGGEYIDGMIQSIMDASQDNSHIVLVLE
jgi:RNAse (barnase) inhibitor barstar